uniref:Crystaline entomocidal protoxin n=1 Tax=Bacillus thuringiensis TaxID=1428 RepID=A0A7G0Y7X7_BACTU|nr:insecticidal crystal protein [Bacillus thuringiensis]
MNSNRNKNEYEILDASSSTSNMTNQYSRYPLANNPQAFMRNTNYKDWLAMCERNDTGVLENPEVLSLRGAVGTGVSIVGMIFSLIGIPVIGEVVGILVSLTNLLWPESEGSAQYTWQELITHVEELMDQRIGETQKANALAKLSGLKAQVAAYNRALEDWEKNPNSRSASEVIARFRSTNNDFVGSMPQFSPNGYEILLLSVYAQAANLHLLLIRDATIYGSQWGLSQGDVNLYYNEQLLYTKQYVNHCVTWYNNGLAQQKALFATSPNWNRFNAYRRDMTINVLDLIALFPIYDARLYPQPVRAELTREIYSNILNSDVYGVQWADFEKNESTFTRPPHLFTWLRKFDFYTRTKYYNQGLGWLFLGGHTNYYSYTNSSNLKSGSYNNFWGSDMQTSTLTIPDNPSIYRLWTKSYTHIYPYTDPVNITQMQFYLTNNQQLTYTATANPRYPVRETNFELPSTDENPLTYQNYSHILSYMISSQHFGDKRSGYTFAWTHNSVDPTNTLAPNKITQIPAVKANTLEGNKSFVVKGPNHTGGDLVILEAEPGPVYPIVYRGVMGITCKVTQAQNYRIRIRYASNGGAQMAISLRNRGTGTVFTVSKTYTGNSIENLQYNDFQYKDMPVILEASQYEPNNSIYVYLYQESPYIQVIIDKIEFIPIDTTSQEYEEKHQLEKAKKAVGVLFTNDAKKALKIDTTDYDVDQAANLIECLSDEQYAKEKMILLDEVKYAKQLSQSRNLLQNGDFESSEIGWETSNTITIQAGNLIFKGKYLNMSGARNIDGAIFPTYAFQKVDESRLKPYTRYKVRGFVGSSKDVEVVVTRYGEEVDTIMNVPNDLTYDVGSVKSCGEWNRCEQQPYQNRNQVLNNSMIIANTSNASNSCEYVPEKKRVMCPEPHQFSFHVDTGETNLNENLGISVLFKISSPEGYAILDNIELIEEGSLVGESLAYVQNREKRWKNKMQAERMETQQAYNIAKQVVDILFTDPQDTALRFETNKSNIISADELVQSIPYIYNDWLRDVPGMNYNMFTELKGRITQAYYLYDDRNVLQNGDFNNGLTSWYVTGNAEVQQIDGTFVLVLQNWSTTVSQNVCLQHNRGYVLRVTARKEGMGNGYVTMSDCANHIEKIIFTSCDNNIVVTSTDSAEYVTRTVSFFPDTDHVRIEIGETEGTFKVESVELICMEGKE